MKEPASVIHILFRLTHIDLLKQNQGEIWSMGTSLRLFSNFASLARSVWFYTGSLNILTFKKNHCNQYYTFNTFIKSELIFFHQC